jgi:putative ABC transport system permease protein
MSKSHLVLAWKVLWRRKFFTFVSLFGIAITLAVLTVVAALADHTFGAHAPEVHGDRSLGVYELEMYSETHEYRGEPGYAFLDRHVRDLPGAEAVTVASSATESATYVDGERITLQVQHADGVFWRVLEFDFLEGQPFTEDDDRNANPVAVISREIRRRVFGGESAVGRSLEIGRQSFRVIGVVENVPPFREFSAANVWVPISTLPSSAYRQGLLGGFRALILAPSRADLPALRAELRSRLDQVDLSNEEGDHIATAAETLFELNARRILGGGEFSAEHRTDGSGQAVDHAALLRLVLAIGALLFMALPSLNLVNLSISRILERASEIGVRKSFGASSRELVAQFVIENLVLTLLGGLLALPLAALVLQALSGTAVVSFANIGLGSRAYLAGLGLAIVFGLLSGAYPAWRMSRLHPIQALKEGS